MKTKNKILQYGFGEIDGFKMTNLAILSNLQGRVTLDRFQGVESEATKITTLLDQFQVEARKIHGDKNLSGTGQQSKIDEAAAGYNQNLQSLKGRISYGPRIAQLQKKIDDSLVTTRSPEERLLRELQMAEIRSFVASRPAEEQAGIYSAAAASGDQLTTDALESGPNYMFDSLLEPVMTVTKEKRRAQTEPSAHAEIYELQRCDAALSLLFSDAESIFSKDVDELGDLAEKTTGESTDD